MLPPSDLCLKDVFLKPVFVGQHVTVEDSYLCGYLKIKGLTEVSCETGSNVVTLTFIPPQRLRMNWSPLAWRCLNSDKD